MLFAEFFHDHLAIVSNKELKMYNYDVASYCNNGILTLQHNGCGESAKLNYAAS